MAHDPRRTGKEGSLLADPVLEDDTAPLA